MIANPRPYSAKLRKLRRRLRDFKFHWPWVAVHKTAYWRRGSKKGRHMPADWR